MFIHNINPIIVSLGPLSIRWYSLVYVFGFIVTYWWLTKLAKEKAIKNLTTENVEQFMIWAIIAIVLGARIFEFIFYQPQIFLQDPLEILRIWHGGMSFHGSLVGVFIVTGWFTKKYKIPLLELGDAIVIPAAFSLFLGRIANFINAELPGKITQVSWCVQFPNAPDPAHRIGCRHPSQIYESIKNIFIFSILMSVWKLWEQRKPGVIMWLFITLYGILRFAVNFWRDDPIIIIGLSMGQLLSIIMFFIGIVGIYIVTNDRKFLISKSSK